MPCFLPGEGLAVNLIKDGIHNALMGIPLVQRLAQFTHNTGRDGSLEKVRWDFGYYESVLDFGGKRVLELGPGKTLETLGLVRAAGARSCTAIDVVRMLDPERAASEGIDYHLYDGGDLPFDPDSFDIVIARDVFEHLRHPQITVPEIHRVLAPGGELAVRINLRDHYHMRDETRWLDFLQYSDRSWWLMTSNRSAFCNRLRRSHWEALLSTSGFAEVSITAKTSQVLAEIGPRRPYLAALAPDDLITWHIDVYCRKGAKS